MGRWGCGAVFGGLRTAVHRSVGWRTGGHRRPGIGLVVSAGVLLLGLPARADSVRQSSFCLRVADLDCAERIEDGSRVHLRQLPRDSEGRRIVYFHSVMDIEYARFFVHSIARGPVGGPGKPRARVPAKGDVPADLRELARTYRLDGRGDVMNFVIEVLSPHAHFRATTSRHVPSYGPVAAKVVDPDGNDLPGSELHEIEIVP